MLLWVSVRIRNKTGKRGFSFWFPLPLFLLDQWTDMAEDALKFLSLFPRFRIVFQRYVVVEIVSAVSSMARGLCHSGPTDLADIETEKDGQQVLVKCLLR